jgi:hypothetical protein
VTRVAPLPLAEYVTTDGTAVYSLFGPKVVGVLIAGGTNRRSPARGECVIALCLIGSTGIEPTSVEDVDRSETVVETRLCFSSLTVEIGRPSTVFSSGISESRSASLALLLNCPMRMKFLIWARDRSDIVHGSKSSLPQ